MKWDQFGSDSSSYYLNKWFTVAVDSTTIEELTWVNAQHQVERLFGFYAYIDLESLARGKHTLTINADTANFSRKEKWGWENSEYNGKLLANISFQYDKQ